MVRCWTATEVKKTPTDWSTTQESQCPLGQSDEDGKEMATFFGTTARIFRRKASEEATPAAGAAALKT